jgi:hypothetical protein
LSTDEVSTLLARDFERYTSTGALDFHSYGVLYDEVISPRFDVEVSTNPKKYWSSLGGVFDRFLVVNKLDLNHVEYSLQGGVMLTCFLPARPILKLA